MSEFARRARQHLPLVIVLIVYVVTIIVVNPLHESAFSDEWAYDLSVRNFLATGIYQPNPWQPAYIPVHATWGALFALIGGYSLTTLQVSTLVLTLAAIAGFYGLALEHGFSPWPAGVLTLMLIGSPLVVAYNFVYMTDLPFLTWVILGLYFYTRALRKQDNLWLMFAGSLAASAAILTRPFGIAFVPALALIWWQTSDRWRRIPFLAVGMLAPVLAFLWQNYEGLVMPLALGRYQTYIQVQYLTENIPQLIMETVWRLMALLQYMAFFCIPLVVLGAIEYWNVLKRMDRSDPARRRETTILFGLTAAIFILVIGGVIVLGKSGVMPIIDWDFYYIRFWPQPLPALLTLVTVAGAIIFGRLFILRYVGTGWRELPVHERFLDIAMVMFAILQLALYHFTDRFVIHLTPYVLLAAGRMVIPLLDRYRVQIASLTCGILLVCAVATRNHIAPWNADWAAADQLLARGVSANDISASWEWMSYHGQVDAYLNAITSKPQLAYNDVPDIFTRVLPEMAQTREYQVVLSTTPPNDPNSQIILSVPVDQFPSTPARAYVLQKIHPGSLSPGVPPGN